MRIYRLTPDGKKWPPALENGFFILGDPAKSNRKHTAQNAVLVRSEEEAIDLLSKGYSIRIETATRPSLVRRNLFVDGLRIS
jgi:hypothetical protein